MDMTDEMAEKCTSAYREIFERNNTHGAVPAFPGVIKTIKKLHDDGLAVTIASSRGHHSLAASSWVPTTLKKRNRMPSLC